MNAVVLRGDAAHLPLPDESVDLIVTSPPYFSLRSYTDNGEHYQDQIGSEDTPLEYLEALWTCTAEWIRVLKPSGSLFVNLGDKYVADNRGSGADVKRGPAKYAPAGPAGYRGRDMARQKSLMNLPHRYAIGCTDRLGLIERAEIVWAKPNGLPESVVDRVRRAHEVLFHFTRLPRYYSAVDEIREPHAYPNDTGRGWNRSRNGRIDLNDDGTRKDGNAFGGAYSERHLNPLGKLPGSVWEIPSAPLSVPAALGVDHFAAFPPALVRPVVLGWSPPGVCTACGQGRRPVTSAKRETFYGAGRWRSGAQQVKDGADIVGWAHDEKWRTTTTITGYACACTPYTDHPGTGERYFGAEAPRTRDRNTSYPPIPHVARGDDGHVPKTGPWREYHFDAWTPPPTRPAIVLDPFGGTGTTALVASVHGRHGISADLSADYCRLARWRVRDPGERARALNVPKPPPVPEGQASLFDLDPAS